MKKLLITSLALALTGMTGCASRYADVPAPTRFENTKQQKLQAAEHWRNIAQHAATQIANDLRDKLNNRAVFVPQPGGEQAFVEGFRELLITALVEQNIPVSTEARNALTVDVRYSIYRFSPDRAKNTYYYGDATMLAAGLWAVGGIVAADISSAGGVSAGVKLLTLAAAADGFSWLSNEQQGRGEYASGPVPRSEIVLTASVVDGTRIVSRRSSIYYTADEDPGLYWHRPAAAHSISIVGDNCDGKKPCAR
jgi:hypothetical protein